MFGEQTMNIKVTDLGNPDRVAAGRAANDAFRATLTGGCLVLTAGIIALGADNQARIIEAVRQCSVFDADDPVLAEPSSAWTDTHDIGDVTAMLEEPGIARWCELIFFKVVGDGPPAAPTGTTGSPDTATRQLIIMLASEW